MAAIMAPTVLECFFATSLSKKSKHSVNRLPVAVSTCQKLALPLLAMGSTVRAYACSAAHCPRVRY